MKKYNKFFYFLKDKDRKNILRILADILKLTIKSKEIPVHYFTRLLYKKDIKNLNDYVSLKDVKNVYKNYFNNNEFIYILEDKIIFNKVMDLLNIPNPKHVGFIVNNKLYTETKVITFTNVKELEEILTEISQSNAIELFLKPNKGINGRGCFSFTPNSEISQENYRSLDSEVYLVQEKIIQHPRLNKVYPHSINTMRINTMYCNGNPEVLSVLLRVGLNNRQVDNGGVFVTVEKGILQKPAYRFLEFGGNTYEYHPNTNIEFEGFEIPHFEEAVTIALKCAKEFPGAITGWDVAITNKGPLVIEGNHNTHLGMADIAFGGLKKNMKFKNLLS